jgi:hypothetical protein
MTVAASIEVGAGGRLGTGQGSGPAGLPARTPAEVRAGAGMAGSVAMGPVAASNFQSSWQAQLAGIAGEIDPDAVDRQSGGEATAEAAKEAIADGVAGSTAFALRSASSSGRPRDSSQESALAANAASASMGGGARSFTLNRGQLAGADRESAVPLEPAGAATSVTFATGKNTRSALSATAKPAKQAVAQSPGILAVFAQASMVVPVPAVPPNLPAALAPSQTAGLKAKAPSAGSPDTSGMVDATPGMKASGSRQGFFLGSSITNVTDEENKLSNSNKNTSTTSIFRNSIESAASAANQPHTPAMVGAFLPEAEDASTPVLEISNSADSTLTAAGQRSPGTPDSALAGDSSVNAHRGSAANPDSSIPDPSQEATTVALAPRQVLESEAVAAPARIPALQTVQSAAPAKGGSVAIQSPKRAAGGTGAFEGRAQPAQVAGATGETVSPFREPTGVQPTANPSGRGGSTVHSTSIGDAFAALDAEPTSGGIAWTHAGARQAEAGFEDPALGWVGVRAELGGSGVHATVLPGSVEAAQALGQQMEGLSAHMAQQPTPVESLTVASPESRSASDGAGQNLSQGANQETGQGAGQEAQEQAGRNSQQLSWVEPEAAGRYDGTNSLAPEPQSLPVIAAAATGVQSNVSTRISFVA